MNRFFHVVTLGVSSFLAVLIAAETGSAQMMGMGSMMRMTGQMGMRGQSGRNAPMTMPNNQGQYPMNPMQNSQYQGAYSPSLTTSPDYPSNLTGNYAGTDKGPKKELPHRTGSLRSAPPDAAVIKVYVPDESAHIMLDGEVVASAGATRYFVTPNLPLGKEFDYAVKVEWTKNGQSQSQEKKIHVVAGKIAEVDFTAKVASR
jgi:uncharacterized protein (TIGR03000 family)